MSADNDSRCPKCGSYVSASQMSDNDQHCPHCDAPLPTALDNNGSSSGSASVETMEYVGGGSTQSAVQTKGGSDPILTGHRIGRFELKSRLGQGAFGVVYLAYDPTLDREVAVKVPNLIAPTERKIRRFLREAKAAARLRHPNIVAVFDSGHAGTHYFIAAEFVDGDTLSQRIADERPSLEMAICWLRDLANALAYAHSEGVVHRDIKPANIMIDQAGRPQLMDFGLAKRDNEDADFTKDGSIIGTPSYMSPEQARGENEDVGEASDQYSLGAVMYELLVGAKPYKGASHLVVAWVASKDVTPPRPRKVNTEIPKDLEACLLKAMEKDVRHRYDKMQDFADDLDRWLRGAPVAARPISAANRLWRWCKRNKAVAFLAATVALLLIVGAIAATIAAFHFGALADSEREYAERAATARDKEADARKAAELTVADQLTGAGVVAGERGNHARASMLFATAARQAKLDPQRVKQNLIRFRNWSRWVAKPVHALSYPNVKIDALRFHPNGNFLVVITADRRLQIWQLDNGRPLALPGGNKDFTWAAFNQSGDRLALVRDESPEVTVYSFPDLQVLHTVKHSGPVRRAEFGPQGELLAVGGTSARAWNLSQQKFVTGELKCDGDIDHLIFSELGDRLFTASSDQLVRVFSITGVAKSDEPLLEPIPNRRGFKPFLVDADRGLITRVGPKQAVWWDTESRTRVNFVTTPNQLRDIVPSPDGQYLAVCDFATAQLWRVADLQKVGAPMKHKNFVYSAAFTPDNKTLVTVSADRKAALWQVPTGAPTGRVIPHQKEVNRIAASPDGRHFATAEDRGLVRVWKCDSDDKIRRKVTLDARESFLRLSADGKRVMAAGWDTTRSMTAARVYDLAAGDEVAMFQVAGLLNDGAISPDDQHAVTLSSAEGRLDKPTPLASELAEQPGVIQFWDAPAGKEIHAPVETPSEPANVVYNSTGDRVAVVCYGGELLLVDPRTGGVLWQKQLGKQALVRFRQNRRVTFSPDDESVVTWGFGTSVKVWNVDDGELRLTLERAANYVLYDVQFSVDGRWLATCGDRSTHAVVVWDFETGQAKKQIAHPDWVYTTQFSADDNLLLTACRDRMARLWDWRTGKLVCPGFQHDDSVLSARFVGDGEFVVTCSNDQSARLWERNTGKPIAPEFQFDGNPCQINVTPSQDRILVSGDMEQFSIISVKDFIQPFAGPHGRRLQLWGELLAGERVIQGGTVTFSSEQWLNRWTEYNKTTGEQPKETEK